MDACSSIASDCSSPYRPLRLSSPGAGVGAACDGAGLGEAAEGDRGGAGEGAGGGGAGGEGEGGVTAAGGEAGEGEGGCEGCSRAAAPRPVTTPAVRPGLGERLQPDAALRKQQEGQPGASPNTLHVRHSRGCHELSKTAAAPDRWARGKRVTLSFSQQPAGPPPLTRQRTRNGRCTCIAQTCARR